MKQTLLPVNRSWAGDIWYLGWQSGHRCSQMKPQPTRAGYTVYPTMLLLRPLRRTASENKDGLQSGGHTHHPLTAFPQPSSPCPYLSCTLLGQRRTWAQNLGVWTQMPAQARKDPPPCLRPGSTYMRVQSRSAPSVPFTGENTHARARHIPVLWVKGLWRQMDA